MRPREQKEFTFPNPGWHRRRLLSFDFLYHRNTVTEKVHSLPRLKEVLKQINLIIILIIFIINFFFLSVFHLGEEWFPSQPSNSIRETGDFFFKQQSALLLLFLSSFFTGLFTKFGKADIWNSKTEHLAVTHYSIRLQFRLTHGARWSGEREARQTHAFRLSSAAYCTLLSCGIAQPRC